MMSVDEREWLRDERPDPIRLTAEETERARAALTVHVSAAGRRRGRGHLRGRGRLRAPRPRRRVLLAASIMGGAAATAAVLTVAGGVGAGRVSRPGRSVAVVHIFPGGRHVSDGGAPELVRTADEVRGQAPPAGDATLVQRRTTIGDRTIAGADLYTDSGQCFYAPTPSGLRAQIAAGHNQGGGVFAREIAAAIVAAGGDVGAQAQKMADAPDPSRTTSSNAMNHGVSLYDNYLWENSQDALIAGAGDPRVRAGVLRILATLPMVRVTDTRTDGQPTLTLMAQSPALPSGDQEQLIVNARTGIPVKSQGGTPAHPGSGTQTVYRVSRVEVSTFTHSG